MAHGNQIIQKQVKLHGKIKVPPDGKQRTNKFRKKESKTFLNYASVLLEDSTAVGIASIIKSKGCFRKSMKIIILVLGLAGFLFHTYQFLQLYWEFSTVPSVENLERMIKPAVTICDNNLIRRRYFCDNRPDLCMHKFHTNFTYKVSNLSDFCTFFRPYCDMDDYYTKVPTDIYIKYEDSFYDWNFTKENGFQIDESLESCVWLDSNFHESNSISSTLCSKPTYVRAVNSEKLPGACYTLESNVNGGNYTEEILKNGIVLRMTLKWKTSNLNNIAADMKRVGKSEAQMYYISFHHPGQLSNPFFQGISLMERRHYKVIVTETDFVRLPTPYSTNCFDYVKDWKKNGGKGPLGRQDCQEKCEIDANFEVYGCVPREIEHPHDLQLCTSLQPFDGKVNKKIQQCLLECRDACFEIRYSAKTVVAGEITEEEAKALYKTPSIVKVDVYFNTLESKISTSKPKYESIELFSYIGGYLGMWIGWSLVAICDFFEIIFYACKYTILPKRKSSWKTNVESFSYEY